MKAWVKPVRSAYLQDGAWPVEAWPMTLMEVILGDGISTGRLKVEWPAIRVSTRLITGL